MRTRIIVGLLILLAFLLTSCSTELSKDEMVAIVGDVEAAINAKDVDAILALHSDDVEILGTPLGRVRGQEQAREFFEGELPLIESYFHTDCTLVGGTFSCKVTIEYTGEDPYSFRAKIKFEDGKIDYFSQQQ